MGVAEASSFLDALEICVRYIDRYLRDLADYQLNQLGIEQSADDAVNEINYRLREDGLGYQYESGQILRVDS